MNKQSSKPPYRQIVESMPAIVYEFDVSQRAILYANRAVLRTTGWSPEELVSMGGTLIAQVVRPEDREAVHAFLEAFARSGEAPMLTIGIEKKGGGLAVLHIEHLPLRSDRLLAVAIDVTEEAALHETYRAQGIMLEQAMQVAQIGLWRLEGEHAWWSAAAREMTGVEPEAAVGPALLAQLLHPEDRDRVLGSLESALREGTEHHMRYRIYRQNDGLLRWLECSANRTAGEQAPYRLVGVVRDVTDAVAQMADVQAKLAEATVFAHATNDAQELFAFIGKDHHYIYVNDAYARFRGKTPSFFVGKSVKSVVGETFYSKIKADIEDALHGRKSVFETRLEIDGQTHVMHATNAPVVEGNQIVGMSVLIRDITKYKALQLKAETALARAQQYFDSAQVLLLVLDTEANIVDINAFGCELMGCDKSELLGLNWLRFTHTTGIGPEHFVSDGCSDMHESVITTPGGRTLRLSWRHYPLRDENGDVYGSISSGLDLSEHYRLETQLRQERDLFRLVNDENPDIIFLKDFDGNFLFGNRALAEHMQTSVETLIGQNELDLLPDKAEAQRHLDDDRAILEAGEIVQQLDTSTGANTQQMRYFSVKKVPFEAGAGEKRLLVIATDVTAHRKQEEQLRQFAAVVEQSDEGVMITDEQVRITAVNPAFSTITGYSREACLGESPKLLKSGRHKRAFYEAMWRRIETEGRWEGEIWNRHKDGGIYPEWLKITEIRDAAGSVTHYVGVFSDLSVQKAQEDKLNYLALHDSLTGLYNRYQMQEQIKNALTANRRSGLLAALLYIDLDEFKVVNDLYGHDVGDALLVEWSTSIAQMLRGDAIMGRFGGDEFVIFLDHLHDETEAAQLAQRLLHRIDDAFYVQGRSFKVGCSIGISVAPKDGIDAAVLLQNADAAMHVVKQEGKNAYAYYDSAITKRVIERMRTEQELRQAVESEAFVLKYQPQIDLRSGKIVAFEALVRWRHPQRGVLAPGTFIEIAERSRLIVPIGEQVLRQAAAQLQQWRNDGVFDGHVAVNVSGVQLEHDDIPGKVQSVLEAYGLPAEALEVEITESVMMKTPERWIELFDTLNRLGTRFAIDDFGTGYSSLAYLRRLPLDLLKIDKSFVDDLPHDPEACAIAETIIVLARRLGMQTIAEGAEEHATVNFLIEAGCDLVQGYYFDQPLWAEEATRRLEQNGRYNLSTGAWEAGSV